MFITLRASNSLPIGLKTISCCQNSHMRSIVTVPLSLTSLGCKDNHWQKYLVAKISTLRSPKVVNSRLKVQTTFRLRCPISQYRISHLVSTFACTFPMYKLKAGSCVHKLLRTSKNELSFAQLLAAHVMFAKKRWKVSFLASFNIKFERNVVNKDLKIRLNFVLATYARERTRRRSTCKVNLGIGKLRSVLTQVQKSKDAQFFLNPKSTRTFVKIWISKAF